jgi:Uma2 family endonuclease
LTSFSERVDDTLHVGGNVMNPATITPHPAAPPPQANGSTRKRWTIAEYRQMARAGLLDGKRTILIHGEVRTMPMAAPPHDIALNLTAAFLASVCPPGHHLRNQQSFNVGTENDPGPDLAIVPGSIRDYTTDAPTKALLVVEVAASSLLEDTTTKAELYATAGVPDYWVIDLEHRQIIVFRDPQPLPTGLGATAYRTHLTLGPTDRVSPLAAPAASILVSDLLP